jgi:hypothetical protein
MQCRWYTGLLVCRVFEIDGSSRYKAAWGSGVYSPARIVLLREARERNGHQACAVTTPQETRVGWGDAEYVKPVKGLEYVKKRVKNHHDHADYADMKGKKFEIGNLELEDEAE